MRRRLLLGSAHRRRRHSLAPCLPPRCPPKQATGDDVIKASRETEELYNALVKVRGCLEGCYERGLEGCSVL